MKASILSLIVIIICAPKFSTAEGMAKKAVKQALKVPDNVKKEAKKKENKKKDGKTLEKIPLLLNVGFGLSKYKLFDVYDKPDGEDERVPSIFGGEIDLSAVIERKTVKKFQHKIPKKYRKLALSFSEFSATHLYIPDTLYIQPRNSSDIEAYGATWGMMAGVGLGWFFVDGGIIATYIHYRDFREPDPIHFIRPGLRGTVGMRIPMLWNRFHLEVGGRGDIYVPQKFYADKSLWNVRGVYARVHVRFPFEIEAKI